jgi:transcriptional regulator with XRE-family HTH domain
MKRTPQDDAFAADFARELARKYSEGKRRGVTDQAFAESIGVARAQLDKYLRGDAMPSVRTVALALREHGVEVPYDKIQVHKSLDSKKRPNKISDPGQMLLPFRILSEGPETIGVSFKPVSTRNFEVHLTVRKIR